MGRSRRVPAALTLRAFRHPSFPSSLSLSISHFPDLPEFSWILWIRDESYGCLDSRQLAGLDPKRIFAAVAAFYGLDDAALSRRHDPHLARAVAAWLCRRFTEASLRELAKWLGLSRADSVPNLTRWLEARLKASPELSDDLTEIMTRASAPAVDIHPAEVTRTQVSRKSARLKTKNKA